jgi:ABC-type transporter Mla subunit MlaD
MLVGPLRRGALLCAALILSAMPALAQAPPAVCLCMKQAVDASNADMAAGNAALADARAALDRLDQQLAALRAQVDVNNPQGVAQFKQLLEQRDAAAKLAGGETLANAQAATARYNDAVAAFNAQCGGRPLPPPPPGPIACPPPR